MLKNLVFLDMDIQIATVVPTKNDNDVCFCLQLLSKTLTCKHHIDRSLVY